MTLQPLPAEFPYIWEKFYFIFYQCRAHLLEFRCRYFYMFCFATSRTDGSWHAKGTVVFALSWLLRFIPFCKEKCLNGKACLASLVFRRLSMIIQTNVSILSVLFRFEAKQRETSLSISFLCYLVHCCNFGGVGSMIRSKIDFSWNDFGVFRFASGSILHKANASVSLPIVFFLNL